MLNYEYIEQLLEKYWQCLTTLEEEAILREFFAQENIPAELLQYRPLFVYQNKEKSVDALGSDFDERMLQMIEEEKTVKARTINIRERLKPLFRAAAVIAILITVSTAVEKAVSTPDLNYPTSRGPQVEQKENVALNNDSLKAPLPEPDRSQAIIK